MQPNQRQKRRLAQSELFDAEQQPSAESPGPDSVCSVCGCDRPAGCHYGVVTCHACKSFFKRTVQHSLAYSCMRLARHCALVSDKTRACGYCRFRKCLRVGMRPQLVRSLSDCSATPSAIVTVAAAAAAVPPAAPAAATAAAASAAEASNPDISLNDDEQEEDDDNDEDAADIDPYNIDLSGLDASLPLEERVIRCVTLACDGFLNTLTSWAKRLPGFNQLILTDRVALIQRRWMLLMMMQIAYNSHPYTDTLYFCNNFTLTEAQANSYRLPRVDPRARTICKRYTQLEITRREKSLLICVMFLETSGYSDWANLAAIDELQTRFLRKLRLACGCNIRLGLLLQLNNDCTAGQVLALGYMDRTLNLEGRPPPPLANEVLQQALALGLPVSQPHRYF